MRPSCFQVFARSQIKPPGLGIQPGGGFVKEHHVRVVDQRGRDGEPLLLSTRQRAEGRRFAFTQIHRFQQRLRVNFHPVNAAQHFEQFGEFQMLEERAALQLHADVLLDRLRVAAHVDAGDGGAAAVGGTHPLDNLDGGGLAGAIGAQQGKDLAALHLEGNTVNRLDISIALAQVLNNYDGGGSLDGFRFGETASFENFLDKNCNTAKYDAGGGRAFPKSPFARSW